MIIIKIMQTIPLFGVLLLLYWFTCQVGIFPQRLNNVLVTFTLPSGVKWMPTWGDVWVLIGLMLLYLEVFKATRTSIVTIFDHLLSTCVLISYLVIWLIYPWGGNSVFLILSTMCLIDVVAGFTITISAARRDLAFGSGQ